MWVNADNSPPPFDTSDFYWVVADSSDGVRLCSALSMELGWLDYESGYEEWRYPIKGSRYIKIERPEAA